MIHSQRTCEPWWENGPPRQTPAERRALLNARVDAACITFLIVVPLAIIGYLMYYANTIDYVGYQGTSDDCKVVGYPTNVATCTDQP